MGHFTFICGDEEFLVQERGKAVFQEWVEATGVDEYSRETIDGRVGNAEELAVVLQQFQSATQTLSLFGSSKVVWLKEVSFLGDNVTGRAKGTQEMLEEHLKPILASLDTANVKVLITAVPVDRRRSLFKWLQSEADFEYIKGTGEKDPSALYALIEEECAVAGVTIDAEARELLIERVSGNARMVKVEAAKLATYAVGDYPAITVELINKLVPHYGEAHFFEAAEVFYSLNLEAALEALQRHFFTNKDARGLISSLQGRNRILIQLRVLQDAGELGDRITKNTLSRAEAHYADHFSGVDGKSGYNIFSQNPYYLSRLARTAARIHLKRLIDFQGQFLNAFEQCLQRPQEQEVVMRETVIRCLG